MKVNRLLLLLFGLTLSVSHALSQINQIWVTHKSNNPSRIVINWYSKEAGDAKVRYQFEDGEVQELHMKENSHLHHVELPFDHKDGYYHYQVATGSDTSARHQLRAYPSAGHALRIAFIGNPGFSDLTNLTEVMRHQQPHMLVTLGDNIASLHQTCGEGNKMCVEAFLKLIDSAPEVFPTVVFMPLLGNHDKEYRDRGTRFPELPVYDVQASAYRTFFELPDDEWKWHFKLPDFNLCLIALDLNHVGDYGTTWQTCHDFGMDSEQLRWYRDKIAENNSMNIVTLYNEKNQTTRGLAEGVWGSLIQQGIVAISGYGYYNEYAEKGDFPFLNTSMKMGDQYPDEFSKFIGNTAGYLVLTINDGQFTLSLQSFDGKLLYQRIMTP